MTDGFAVQASYKFGKHGQHMLNVRGNSTEEFAKNAADVEQMVTGITQLGEALNPITEEEAVSSIQTQLGGQVIANNAGKVCAHGPMTYKTGMGKNGSPWQAWMCSARVCSPEWIKS